MILYPYNASCKIFNEVDKPVILKNKFKSWQK